MKCCAVFSILKNCLIAFFSTNEDTFLAVVSYDLSVLDVQCSDNNFDVYSSDFSESLTYACETFSYTDQGVGLRSSFSQATNPS